MAFAYHNALATRDTLELIPLLLVASDALVTILLLIATHLEVSRVYTIHSLLVVNYVN